jgi:hypothetical protein
MALFGIGPAGAARILADVLDITRFPTNAHLAAWNGTAPLDASSGQQIRHRLSRPSCFWVLPAESGETGVSGPSLPSPRWKVPGSTTTTPSNSRPRASCASSSCLGRWRPDTRPRRGRPRPRRPARAQRHHRTCPGRRRGALVTRRCRPRPAAGPHWRARSRSGPSARGADGTDQRGEFLLRCHGVSTFTCISYFSLGASRRRGCAHRLGRRIGRGTGHGRRSRREDFVGGERANSFRNVLSDTFSPGVSALR